MFREFEYDVDENAEFTMEEKIEYLERQADINRKQAYLDGYNPDEDDYWENRCDEMREARMWGED